MLGNNSAKSCRQKTLCVLDGIIHFIRARFLRHLYDIYLPDPQFVLAWVPCEQKMSYGLYDQTFIVLKQKISWNWAISKIYLISVIWSDLCGESFLVACEHRHINSGCPFYPLFLDRETTARYTSASAFEQALWGQVRFLMCDLYSWFSRDVTKIQTKGLSILQSFYIHEILEQLKTDIFTSFYFERVLRFVIEYAWISNLLRDAAFTQRPRELSCRFKKWLIWWDFAI